MEEPIEIDDVEDENRPLTVLKEVRSLLFSGVGIVVSTKTFLQNEIELASRRRFLLTVLLITLISSLIDNLGYIIAELSLGIPLPQLSIGNALLALFVNFVPTFSVSLALIYVMSWWSHSLLQEQGDEIEFVVHTQSLAIITMPIMFVLTILLEINEYVLLVDYFSNRSTSSNWPMMVLVASLSLGVAVYYYLMMSRIFYIIYPMTSRKVRRDALIRIFAANFVFGSLIQIEAFVNIVSSLLPPGTFF